MTLQLLGSPLIRLEGEELSLGRRKATALLVYLAVTARRQSRDTLIDLLYPQKNRSRAGADFRQTLSVLAAKIGKNRLDIKRSSIALQPVADLWVDTQVFRKLTVPIHRTGESGTAVDPQTLNRAVHLYRGHFLSGFYLKDSTVFDDWQFFEQEVLKREYAAALRHLIKIHQTREEWEAAIEMCHRLVALDAFDESAQRQLMCLFTLAGQRTKALQQYQRFKSILLEELCEEPDVETEQLYNQIRSRQLVSRERQPTEFHPQLDRLVGNIPLPCLKSGKLVLLFADAGSKRRQGSHSGSLNRIVKTAQDTLVDDEGRYQFVFPTVSAALRAAVDAQLFIKSKTAEQGGLEGLGLRLAMDVVKSDRYKGRMRRQAAERAGLLLHASHQGQILLSSAAAELAAEALPAGTELRCLGNHRLNDLTPPQSIFQLLHPDLTPEFPSLTTLDSRPNNLPTQSTPLVGRERDVETVRRLLQQNDVRAVTLTGPAGTGKTRLALRVAAGLSASFEQGLYFVDLAPLNSADKVIPTIARVLNLRVSMEQTTTLLETLKGFLRNRRILLLLDNFEHLLSAAAQVEELLLSCTELKVLVTSRELLRSGFERTFAVSTLCCPEKGAEWNPEWLNHYSAVCLFVERSISVQPDFRISKENASIVRDICLKLDGLPLAIELAASCLRFLSLRDLRKRLSHRLILLKGGPPDPMRHRTLRNAIDWSYTLLSKPEKKLFALLSLFVGGCTLDAAEKVAAADSSTDILDGLRSLVEKSLLKQKDDDGVSRYWLLETIREYARLCFEKSIEADAGRQRHADYFLELAVYAEHELRGPDQMMWLERLSVENDNLQAALRWFADHGKVKESLQMGSALIWYWFRRGHISEDKRWLEEALSLDLSTVSLDLRAKALYALGFLLFFQGYWFQARKILRRGLALYHQSGERRWQILTMSLLGVAERWLGEQKKGNAHCLKAVRIAREEGDSLLIADSLMKAYGTTSGKFVGHAPLQQLEEALRRFKQIGDLWSIAHGFNSLGDLFLELGDTIQARFHYEEALRLFRAQKDLWMSAWNLEGLGRVSLEEDNLSEAVSNTLDSLKLFYQCQDRSNTLILLSRVGTIYSKRGSHRRAAFLLGAVDTLSDVGNNRRLDQPAELTSFCTEYQTDYIREWARGQASTLDQAVAYAVHTNEDDEEHPGVGSGNT